MKLGSILHRLFPAVQTPREALVSFIRPAVDAFPVGLGEGYPYLSADRDVVEKACVDAALAVPPFRRVDVLESTFKGYLVYGPPSFPLDEECPE